MWKDLSMGERAALIKIAVDSGVHSIDDIVNTYQNINCDMEIVAKHLTQLKGILNE